MKTIKNGTVKTVKKLPKGWKVVKGTPTQPRGTVLISNGKSLFDKVHKNYEQKLLIVDKAAYEKSQRAKQKKVAAPKKTATIKAKPTPKKKPTAAVKRVTKTEMKLVGKRSGNTISVTKKMPKGWRVIDGATTQPAGTVWIANGSMFGKKDKNGKPIYNKNYKQKLLIKDNELFTKRIKEPDSRYKLESATVRKSATKKKVAPQRKSATRQTGEVKKQGRKTNKRMKK